MSQRNRIGLAAAALAAALCLATPAPSHAAASRPWRNPAVDTWERVWSWMAGFLPAGASQKPARQDKEGGAINPNGSTIYTVPVPPASPSSNSGTK